MATLKVKIQEDIILDNQDYGSKRILEISSIASIVKRIVSVSTTETGLLGFATSSSTDLSKSYLAGLFDEDDVRYIRITNLDSTNHIILVFKSEHAGGNVIDDIHFGTPFKKRWSNMLYYFQRKYQKITPKN